MNENQTPWEAIAAYLNDRMDKESEAKLKTWLAESEENIGLFKEIVNTQIMTRRVEGAYQPDEEKLWAELVSRIQVKKEKRKPVVSSILKYAAIAAAILGAFWVGQQFSFETTEKQQVKLAYTTIFAEPGQRTHLLLPDSTKVWLNSGSELKYPSEFSQNQRDVYISGECYFEVTKNKHKPFIVHAKELNVKVFGTHFNVKENYKSGQSEVTLVEGKVQVLNAGNESLTFLEPGEHLILKGNQFKVEKESNPDALIAWTNGILSFSDKPFAEVVEYLENWYGVKIRLEKSLEKNRYTFKVKTESLREMLYLISQFTPIDYEIEGDQVIIKRKS